MAQVVEFIHRRPPYAAGERVAFEAAKAASYIKAGIAKPYDLEAAARASAPVDRTEVAKKGDPEPGKKAGEKPAS